MIGHVGGLPVEEVLPALMGGGGAFLIGLASIRGRVRSRTARRRRPTEAPEPDLF